MSYLQTIESLAEDPEALELAYRQAVKAGDEAAFAEAVEAAYAQAGDNRLLAAWHCRLAASAAVEVAATASAAAEGPAAAASAAAEGAVKGRVIAWAWALPLGVLNGLLLWLLSDDKRFTIRLTNPVTGAVHTLLPALFLLAAPISAALIALFLTLAGGRLTGGLHWGRWRVSLGWGRALAVGLGLAAGAAYVLLLSPRIWPRVFQEQYLGLMVLHLGLLAWAGAGLVALARRDDRQNRFAFLVKSLEAVVVGGLLAIGGGILTGITFGLFNALGITLPMVVQRLFIAGGGGLIAVVAVALVYDPRLAPAQQSFEEGLSKLVALLMRLLLPLTVGVLLVYLAFIPFNWRAPFENRDVLLIFNAMLFAVVALLMAVTPVREGELGEKTQTWLRRGAISLAALSLLVSLYALAAILYRTANGHITPNRLLFIGWDVVNITILALLLIGQARAGRARWLQAMHRAFAAGVVLYLAWSLAGLLAPPWLFRGDPAGAAGLPVSIQGLIYEQPQPILLKCAASQHIYLLEEGRKRWIVDIPTLQAEGYRWDDIRFVACDDLRRVPDGETIPPGSGSPPQP